MIMYSLLLTTFIAMMVQQSGSPAYPGLEEVRGGGATWFGVELAQNGTRRHGAWIASGLALGSSAAGQQSLRRGLYAAEFAVVSVYDSGRWG